MNDGVDTVRKALERIAKWFGEFPETGRTWPDGSPMSYSAAHGSNGERDYMRGIAREALAMHSEAQTVAALAVAIADDIARSDIESFAVCGRVEENGGFTIYSLTETPPVIAGGDPGLVRTHDDAIEELRVVQRAAKYIRERGDVFDFHMIDAPGHPGYVRFIEKADGTAEPGEGA